MDHSVVIMIVWEQPWNGERIWNWNWISSLVQISGPVPTPNVWWYNDDLKDPQSDSASDPYIRSSMLCEL